MWAFLRTNLRRAKHLVGWLLGSRWYPWTESPPHRMLATLARIAYHRGAWPFRLAYIFLSAVLKHRERIYADHMNFTAALRGPVTQEALRSVVDWQRSILLSMRASGVSRGNGNLCIAGDVEDVQLDRVFSLFCVSGVFGDFSLFWGEPALKGARPWILTKAEQRRAARGEAPFALGAVPVLDAGAVDPEELARVLVPLFEPRRAVINYLKMTHPGAFIVALSLQEDADGFSDPALEQWLPHLREFRRRMPAVVFCLLNRTRVGQPATAASRDVAPVRGLGLGLQEAIVLAQEANAYLGCLDVFGLAAIGARRPGIYFDPSGRDRRDSERLVWTVAEWSPARSLDVLRTLIRRSGPPWDRMDGAFARSAGRP